MPKGLVVYLDDDTYKKLKAMSTQEGKTLKDLSYDIIKNAVDKNQKDQKTGSIIERLFEANGFVITPPSSVYEDDNISGVYPRRLCTVFRWVRRGRRQTIET
jgi:hypothetical protein